MDEDKLREWLSDYGFLWEDGGCCLHAPPWSPGDVTSVAAWIWDGYGAEGWRDGPKTASDSESASVVTLRQGGYGLLLESEDYTGHGCQCSSAALIAADIPGLLLHVEDGPKRRALAARLS